MVKRSERKRMIKKRNKRPEKKTPETGRSVFRLFIRSVRFCEYSAFSVVFQDCFFCGFFQIVFSCGDLLSVCLRKCPGASNVLFLCARLSFSELFWIVFHKVFRCQIFSCRSFRRFSRAPVVSFFRIFPVRISGTMRRRRSVFMKVRPVFFWKRCLSVFLRRSQAVLPALSFSDRFSEQILKGRVTI